MESPRRRSRYFRLLVLLCLAGAVTFGLFAAGVVVVESVAHLDTSVAQGLRRHAVASPGVVTFFQAVTWFGTFPAFTVLSILAIIAIAAAGKPRLAIGWLVALLGSGLVVDLLKNAFDRPRMIWEQPFAVEESFSFPSGHATSSTVGYGMVAYCLALRWPSRQRRVWLAVVLAAWVLLIGFSRLYLGVHYLSDVLAGFALGLAWLALCVVVIEEVRARL